MWAVCITLSVVLSHQYYVNFGEENTILFWFPFFDPILLLLALGPLVICAVITSFVIAEKSNKEKD